MYVVCINNDLISNRITLDKIYKVESNFYNKYVIVNDRGRSGCYSMDRFILLRLYRLNKLLSWKQT